MFNYKKAKAVKSQSSRISPSEKSLEENRGLYDLEADDNPSTHESLLEQDRKGEIDKTTEAQMKREAGEAKRQITEKNLKREKIGTLYVPAINAFVEELVQERRKEYTDMQQKKEGHWTLDKADQNADLPKWPAIAEQHDKMVLPNDVDRKPNDEPLIGGKILKASVDDVVLAVKCGATKNYDERIVEVLKMAHDQNRDLSVTEKNYINDVKQRRTMEYLKEA